MDYYSLGKAAVALDGIGDAERARLQQDLEPFFEHTKHPHGEVVAHVHFSSDPDHFRSLSAELDSLRYRLVPMHCPSDSANHRLGRFSSKGLIEYVHHTTKGSIYELDFSQRRIHLIHPDRKAGAKEIRRLIRDQLLTFWYEAQGAVVVHAALLEGPRGAVLVPGRPGSGKTSVFLSGLSHPQYRGTSTERVVIVPRDGALVAYGLPEKINFMPGTLAAFEETAAFAAGYAESDYWARSKKFLIHHARIFEAFNANAGRNGLPLTQVIYPAFGGDYTRWSGTSAETTSALQSEILSFGDQLAHTNWLGWFNPNGSLCKRTCASIAATRSEFFTWGRYEDISRMLSELA